MIERFLFDRIDAKTGGTAVGRQYHLVADVLTHEASTALAFMQLTVTRTEVALNTRRLAFLGGQGVPPTSRVGGFRGFYVSFHF